MTTLELVVCVAVLLVFLLAAGIFKSAGDADATLERARANRSTDWLWPSAAADTCARRGVPASSSASPRADHLENEQRPGRHPDAA